MSTSTPRASSSGARTLMPDLRQRASLASPRPAQLGRRERGVRKRASASSVDGQKDAKGKGKAKAKAEPKAKGKWDVGTKGWVKEGFRKFGEHCARNQIRTLLIDCLVMTNLFYPSVAVWYQKRAPSRSSSDLPHAGPSRLPYSASSEPPFSLLSTPLLDSFYPSPIPLLPPIDAGGWWPFDPSRSDEKYGERRWNGTRVGRNDPRGLHPDDEELRLVRIGWTDVATVLHHVPDRHWKQRQWVDRDHDLLSMIRETVNGWEGDHPGSRERCVREFDIDSKGSGPAPWASCLDLPPHNPGDPFFGAALEHDTSNIHPSAYWWSERLIRSPLSSAETFDVRWQAALESVADRLDAVVVRDPGPPTPAHDPWYGEWLISLEPEPAREADHSLHDLIKHENRYGTYFTLLYIAMIGILAFQVNFATRVHSKFGLAVTGIVQLCCSAIMSLSVLALIGWNGWGWSSLPSSVPIWVLPMVIVIVGVENMSTLTKAVFSVPFHYSVPERIGLGLSRSGTTILFTTLTNILALAIIWYFVDVVPVREFCLFAITVNITDWFMLHTFYLTVISIDAQRLELADVLATSGNQDPATQTVSIEEPDDAKYIFSWRGLLAGRMFKNGTLVLTLICVGLIYLLTDRGSSSLSSATPVASRVMQSASALTKPTPFHTTISDLAGLSDAERLWREVNPEGWPSIRVNIPAAFVIVLPTPGQSTLPADLLGLVESAAQTFRLPRFKALFYFLKVVILPQALTAGSLWALLRYLLKDADLLDAQRDRLGRSEETPLDDHAGSRHGHSGILASRSAVHMLPCGHAADIEHIAVSHDGSSAVTVALDNTIALWRFSDLVGHGTREMLVVSGGAFESGIATVAIDSQGDHVAAVTDEGHLAVWRITNDDSPRPLPAIDLGRKSRGLISVHFEAIPLHANEDPFQTTARHQEAGPLSHPPVSITYDDGTVIAVDASSCVSVRHRVSQSQGRALPVPSDNPDESAIIITDDHGQWLHRDTTHWAPVALESHAAPGDRLTAVSPWRQFGQHASLIAVGRASGVIEVFDSHQGELVASVGQMQHLEGISDVDIVRCTPSRCTGCGTSCSEGFTVVSSSGEQVFVDRVIPPSTIVCRCGGPRRSIDESARAYLASNTANGGEGSPTKSRSTDSLVVPPDSARAKLSPSSSPRRSPSLLPPTSNGEFPLSSHGTRKLSAYQSHESSGFTPTSATTDRMPTAIDSLGISASESIDTLAGWTDMEVVPLGAVFAPSGTWVIVGEVVIGLRRSCAGIGHDQWQIWMIDLSAPYNGTTLNVETSPLGLLEENTRHAWHERMKEEGGLSTTAQRTERLHSISGRAAFPSVRGSFSVPTYPTLAYVDIRSMVAKGSNSAVVAFGNQLGVISLPPRNSDSSRLSTTAGAGPIGTTLAPPSAQRTPRSRLSSTSGLDRRSLQMGAGLGITPPPPRRSEDKKAV